MSEIDVASVDSEKLELIHFADPRMTVKPPAFDFEKDKDKAELLASVLKKAMKRFGGVGISANQLGMPFRVFTIGNEEKQITMFNPQIVGVSKEKIAMEEGCISFPGFFLTLQRPQDIVVSYQDEHGEYVTAQYTGVAARIILHEYDHMEGINFTFHASNFKLKYTLDRFKKRQKKAQQKLLQRAQHAKRK
jgi:peptide deformylase